MYKVIIVDDDSIIRKGLSRNIGWEVHGFELCGSAGNGEEALALIERLRPHLVVTDIRMPFMDGFRLTETVKERYPETKIIMLTSYDEFELAKNALRLKVFDYLLKPVEHEVLLDAAQRAMDEWQYEMKMKKKVMEGLPLLKQQFLEKWVLGKLTEEEIRQGMEFLNLELAFPSYSVMVLKADDFSYPEYQKRFGQELLKYCILNVANELLAQSAGGIAFDSQDDEVVVVCGAGHAVQGWNVDAEAMELAESIRLNVERYLKTTVTVGVGFAYGKLAGVSRSYRDARSALEFRHIVGTNRVLTVEDAGVPSRPERSGLNERKNELLAKVRLGMEEEALAVLALIEQEVRSDRFLSMSQYRLIGIEIALMLFTEMDDPDKIPNLPEEGASEGREWSDFYAFSELLHRQRTVREMFDVLERLVRHWAVRVHSRRDHHMKQAVREAAAYVEQNYMKEGLSLQEVGRAVHVSPTYLSYIFKKEKKINFSDYLLQIRMKAAMDLLRFENWNAYEVAEKVGYANSQYFSVCFKKYTGMSPSEFKHSVRSGK